ncbi:MAG: ATP-dependent helicase [Lachnospiraceae bacterium]
MSLNQAQHQAIAHKEGPCMVLAGPGSGKTLVVTKRIEYLIKQYHVAPQEILVVTFTKAAVKEMKERFYRLIQARTTEVTFGTFHGIYYGILKWAYGFGPQNLLSDEEKYQLLKQVSMSNNLEIPAEIEDEKEFLQDIASEISYVKNNRMELNDYEPSSCSKDVFDEIYTQYEQQRKQYKKIDFDDMLVLCYELFCQRPDILAKWQKRYSYILVDEFQDINRVQYDVICMLAGVHHNLFVVGDDDQSIYKFRGADPELILGFKEAFPDTIDILLDKNYRSTQSIVAAADRIISHNITRYKKEIHTDNEQGSNVQVHELLNTVEESKYVLKKIEEIKKQGIKSSQIAVMFRTNIEARTFVETCLEYNVKFQMKEHLPNLYEHFINQDLCCYMRMAMGKRKRKDMLKIMNRPKRYLSRESLENETIDFEKLRCFYCDKLWMQDRIDQMELDLRILKNMAPYAAIQYIRKRIGYDGFLEEYAMQRRMSLEELKEIICEIEEHAKEYKDIEEWLNHIETYAVELKKQTKQQVVYDADTMTLITMHGAKGLEYEAVFIIGANEDIIPYKKAKLTEDIEEERRLFYVAVTRAKKQLTITYTKEKNGKEMIPSRFIHELLVV